MRLEHDVLVAGGGPAGAHTALRLARAGWSVCLVDARTFPRLKPCGEFLSPACLPMLEELDLLSPLEQAGGARVGGMDLNSTSSRARGEYVKLGRFAACHGHGIGIRREVLDTLAIEALEAEATATVLQGWRTTRTLRDTTGRVVGLEACNQSGQRHELRARFTVGADGLRSRIAREMGWIEPRRGVDRFAIVARFRGVPVNESPGGAQGAEVHFVGRDYFAACPIDDGLFTANLVVDATDMRAECHGHASLESFFQSRVERAPALAARLAGAELAEEMSACGPLRSQVRRVSAPGLALVGDACGFVDPLTGEGLYFAMGGARLLARAVGEALETPAHEARARRRYAWQRRLQFGPRYAVARWLQLGLRVGGLPERAVALLAKTPGLCDLSLAWTGDYLPPRALLSPQVWWNTLNTASR